MPRSLHAGAADKTSLEEDEMLKSTPSIEETCMMSWAARLISSQRDEKRIKAGLAKQSFAVENDREFIVPSVLTCWAGRLAK